MVASVGLNLNAESRGRVWTAPQVILDGTRNPECDERVRDGA